MTDTILKGLLALIVLVVAGFVVYGLYCLWIYVAYKSHYGEVITTQGVVTDMDYHAPYTTTTTSTANGVTTVNVQHHPEKNEVYLSFDNHNTYYDSDRLYQRVRVGEKVTVVYQEEWLEPRFWNGKLKFDSPHTLTVTSEKDQGVRFHNEKPVSRKIPAHE